METRATGKLLTGFPGHNARATVEIVMYVQHPGVARWQILIPDY